MMLPSVPGDSMEHFLCVGQLNSDSWTIPTLLFFTMLMTSSTYLYHHALGMERSGPNSSFSMYSIRMLSIREFSFDHSKATYTRMLVNRAHTSKDTRVAFSATFFSLRQSAKSLLSLTN